MATPNFGGVLPGKQFAYQGPSVSVPWPAMANGDVGIGLPAGNFIPRALAVSGTFGVAGSISWEVTLDGTNWFVMKDTAGNAITLTGAGVMYPVEGGLAIRPHVTAGDVTTAIVPVAFLRRMGLSQ